MWTICSHGYAVLPCVKGMFTDCRFMCIYLRHMGSIHEIYGLAYVPFVFRVMDVLDIEEIPERHIVKRWTKDARDILPGHLAHYQKDQSVNQSSTCRHSTLYLQAMEVVRMGDASAEAYEHHWQRRGMVSDLKTDKQFLLPVRLQEMVRFF